MLRAFFTHKYITIKLHGVYKIRFKKLMSYDHLTGIKSYIILTYIHTLCYFYDCYASTWALLKESRLHSMVPPSTFTLWLRRWFQIPSTHKTCHCTLLEGFLTKNDMGSSFRACLVNKSSFTACLVNKKILFIHLETSYPQRGFPRRV